MAGLMLAACAPQVPDSGAGVGFSEYSQYEIERARREAQLSGGAGSPIVNSSTAIVPPSAAGVAPGSTIVPSGGISTSDLAAAGIGAPIGAGTIGTAPATTVSGQDVNRTSGVQASPTNAPVNIASSGISSEQDFDAVASERGIEDDAALREQQQAAYTVIQPTALPTRDGDVGPNIVEYALNAPNRRGQEWYSRSLLTIDAQGKFERNCSSYRSADEAQRDFLERGGPERDPRGIDPDGDGFACGWDPAPFLLVVGRG
ncbi:hypothetical protein [Flavimaricola marinus]|uniref:hypothetical protein n=1 Tax=Flavimaricola marinus TaxID=1819565 RepID=UPI001FE46E44|nr:hypothetical protein [Flavimaricola marinus]